jgi:hypothetical protein
MIHNKKILILYAFSLYAEVLHSIPMYFSLAADTEHFALTKRIIEDIKETNNQYLEEIAIFDLGFKESERLFLEKQDKVIVRDLILTHPDQLKKFKTRNDGAAVRGWFAWKPLVLKQSLELYPYFLYLDSALRVVGDMSNIFSLIKEDGYFFTGCFHNIRRMTTKKVYAFFELDKDDSILNVTGLCGGIQGISHKIKDSYINTIYNYSYDLELFKDDGSAPGGFGDGRHDQTLFSILAHKLQLKTTHNLSSIMIDNNKILFKYFDYWLFKNYHLP